MRIAVSGATGQIGKYVIKSLKEHTNNIVLLTRDISRMPPELAGIESIQVNIHSIQKNLFDKLGKPDILIHLAWEGLPNYTSQTHISKELPAQYNFLKNLLDSGLSNLMVTGTCYEYGLQSGCLKETDEAEPINEYACAKKMLLLLIKQLQQKIKFNLTWARLFYLYGEGQRETSLYSQLEKAVKNGEASFNMSGGKQTRDYLTLEKASDYLVRLALLRENIGVVNVCSGSPVSVEQIVRNFLTDKGWQIELNLGYYQYISYEPMHFWGDTTKLLSYLSNKAS